MGIVIDLSIVKTNKWSQRESGDTAEMVERPGGGFSIVAVDGQGSGAGAKSLSLLLTSKAVALLKEGVRDGAVARAVHDVLFAYRQGKVSASLDILSVDLKTKSVLATRNAETPLIVRRHEGWLAVPSAAGSIGLYHFTRPAVIHLPAEDGLAVCLFTDGIANAGNPVGGNVFDVQRFLAEQCGPDSTASEIADRVLAEAIHRDSGRPRDDMTIAALSLRGHESQTLIRRLDAVMPVP
jgi:serine phosphatase RsbU (regulator of sigma subunit)